LIDVIKYVFRVERLFGIKCLWNGNACLDLAWIALPLVLFGVDHVSSVCWSLTSRSLIWHVDNLISLRCFRMGVVRSAYLQTFGLRVGEILAAELDSRMLPSEGLTDQRSCELGTLRGKNSYIRVRPLSIQHGSVEFGRDLSEGNPTVER